MKAKSVRIKKDAVNEVISPNFPDLPSIVPLEASQNLEHKFNTNNELEVCRQNLYEAKKMQ